MEGKRRNTKSVFHSPSKLSNAQQNLYGRRSQQVCLCLLWWVQKRIRKRRNRRERNLRKGKEKGAECLLHSDPIRLREKKKERKFKREREGEREVMEGRDKERVSKRRRGRDGIP